MYNKAMQMRQKKILQILKEKKDWITGKELSTILSVSDRTIRSDMEQLGKTYKGIIESSVRYGYRINEDVSEESDLEQREHIPPDLRGTMQIHHRKTAFKQTEIKHF